MSPMLPSLPPVSSSKERKGRTPFEDQFLEDVVVRIASMSMLTAKALLQAELTHAYEVGFRAGSAAGARMEQDFPRIEDKTGR